MPEVLRGPPKKHNIYRRQKLQNKEQLIADTININWMDVISPQKMDSNYSLEKLLENSLDIVNKHMPLKKMSKKDLKLEAKPWITPGIITSIKRRDSLLREYIKCPEGDNKNNLHVQYKVLRNRIVALMRLSKNNHLRNYFSNNSDNIKKTWQGIKSIISIRETSHNLPTMSVNNINESDPTKIANGFNSYFSTIAEKLQNLFRKYQF